MQRKLSELLPDDKIALSSYIRNEGDELVFFKVVIDATIKFTNHSIQFNGKTYDYNIINSTSQTKQRLIFENCKFKEEIEIIEANQPSFNFKKCAIKSILFKNYSKLEKQANFSFSGTPIDTLTIKDSKFGGKFYINDIKSESLEYTKIKKIEITNSEFSENFKLHDCQVESIEVNNVDFLKNADFYRSHFLQESPIVLKAINFQSLALFGECKFHSKFILEFVSFRNLTHFREAEFLKGLDLDKTNIEKEINFYGAKGLENSEYISQETYRIIKYNCQKIANQIEANKYHALELKKRKEALIKGNFFDYIVFYFNWHSSRFSTNWGLSLFWIIITGIITTLLIHLFVGYVNDLKDTFKYMSILTADECIKANPLIFMFNKTALGYLYYQLVTSIRKDTRK